MADCFYDSGLDVTLVIDDDDCPDPMMRTPTILLNEVHLLRLLLPPERCQNEQRTSHSRTVTE